ncbi:MAG: hypothetical protein KDM63_14460, partial [Verrucomicrobiae bacterium]|nr:hypothetical protein [Verrucomicrobiae bacterium]
YHNDHESSASPIPPRITLDGGTIVVEGDQPLPTHWCVKCGRPSHKLARISLRNPANPISWYASRPKIEVGLCRQHNENHAVAQALSWSMLGVGCLIVLGSVISISGIGIAIGLGLMFFSGLVRSSYPLSSKITTYDYYQVDGSCETYRNALLQSGLVTTDETDTPGD